jgi:hypothetical protein
MHSPLLHSWSARHLLLKSQMQQEAYKATNALTTAAFMERTPSSAEVTNATGSLQSHQCTHHCCIHGAHAIFC